MGSCTGRLFNSHTCSNAAFITLALAPRCPSPGRNNTDPCSCTTASTAPENARCMAVLARQGVMLGTPTVQTKKRNVHTSCMATRHHVYTQTHNSYMQILPLLPDKQEDPTHCCHRGSSAIATQAPVFGF